MKTPVLNKMVIYCIVGIRPLFGAASCRYVVTCTQFAVVMLQDYKLLPALWMIIKRVCACNPLW